MQNGFSNQSPWKAWRWRYKRLLKGGNYFETRNAEMAFVGGCISLSFCDGNLLLWKVYFIIFSYHSHHHKNRCRPPKRASLHSGEIPSDWAPYKKQCIRSALEAFSRTLAVNKNLHSSLPNSISKYWTSGSICSSLLISAMSSTNIFELALCFLLLKIFLEMIPWDLWVKYLNS